MPGLTPKRENFAHAVASGRSQADAYRMSFDASRATAKTIQEAASRLMADSKVAARVAELRAPIIEKVGVTLESHLNELARLRRMAEHEGQISAAVKAEELRGKVCGLYTEKVEHVGAVSFVITPAESKL